MSWLSAGFPMQIFARQERIFPIIPILASQTGRDTPHTQMVSRLRNNVGTRGAPRADRTMMGVTNRRADAWFNRAPDWGTRLGLFLAITLIRSASLVVVLVRSVAPKGAATT
jgi:hypothetical protein